MEACLCAHHRAPLFADHGHTVRLMAPKFAAPYRLTGKRDKNDAIQACSPIDLSASSYQKHSKLA
jgi:transposase